MFHRQRNDQPGQPTPADDTASVEPTVQQQPEAPAVTDRTLSHQQPHPSQKEAAPMSNYNTPNNEPVTGDVNAQVPGTASFTPQQRAMQPVVRSPYAGYSPAYGSTNSVDPSVSTGRKLVIGEGITLSGEIEACDHLIVEGTVEATLKGASILDVAQTGMFFGAVEINEATVAGRFEGDIIVNGRLTVRSTGTISGTISYKELAVESGATIDGKINPMREGKVTSQSVDQKKSGGIKVKPSSNQDSSSELPLAARASAAE
jgi:cytoskeletal protein CcmA (bactofilin family)